MLKLNLDSGLQIRTKDEKLVLSMVLLLGAFIL